MLTTTLFRPGPIPTWDCPGPAKETIVPPGGYPSTSTTCSTGIQSSRALPEWVTKLAVVIPLASITHCNPAEYAEGWIATRCVRQFALNQNATLLCGALSFLKPGFVTTPG